MCDVYGEERCSPVKISPHSMTHLPEGMNDQSVAFPADQSLPLFRKQPGFLATSPVSEMMIFDLKSLNESQVWQGYRERKNCESKRRLGDRKLFHFAIKLVRTINRRVKSEYFEKVKAMNPSGRSKLICPIEGRLMTKFEPQF